MKASCTLACLSAKQFCLLVPHDLTLGTTDTSTKCRPEYPHCSRSRRGLSRVCSTRERERYVCADSETQTLCPLTDMWLYDKRYMTGDFTWSDIGAKPRHISLLFQRICSIYIFLFFSQGKTVSFPFSYIILALRNTTARTRLEMETMWFWT